MNRYSTMKGRARSVMFAIVVLLGWPLSLCAHTLELGSDGKTTISITLTGRDSLHLMYEADTILIDEIVLTYDGRAKDSLTILLDRDNTRVFSGEVTNSLSSEEIKKLNRGEGITLSIGETYTISHGNKMWELSFIGNSSAPSAPEEDESEVGENEPTIDNSKNDIWNWHFIMALLVVFGAGVAFILLERNSFKKGDSSPEPPSPESEKPSAASSTELDERGKLLEQIGEQVRSTLEERMPDIIKQELEKALSEVSKRERIPDSQYKEDTLGQENQRREITDAQLSDEANRPKLTNFYIDQLSKSGFSDFNNEKEKIPFDEFWRNIADSLKKAKDESLRPSDEDIVTQAIRDKKLTNEQKEMLLHGLVESINQNLGENKKFVNTSLDEFVGQVVKIIQDAESLQNATEDNLLKLMKEGIEGLEAENLGEAFGKVCTLEEHNKEMNEKTNAITELEREKENLMSATQSMLDKLHSYADALEDKQSPLLFPCSDSFGEQCEDIEGRLYMDLKQVANRIKEFTLPDSTPPTDTKRAIQNLLVDIINEEDSPIDRICRYYAYSRLPFMSDRTREYGIYFNRLNMGDLFRAVNHLFVAFGISFDIPVLFVMGIDEGHYENLTGRESSDLDSFCPNSCNHVGSIDTKNRPANVVVDIVKVGYTVEGKNERRTSVLTY